MGRCVVAVVCIAVVAACALPKPTPPAPTRQTQLGLSIKSMTLANGLRVVLVNDPHASEVQVTMRYRVGAGDDLENPGIAHLVEHLMFQQTLGAQTLFAHLEDNATFFNASTTFDATTYVSRARPDYLDKLLSIEAVRLGFRCTSITDSAFLREREVVTHELKLNDDVTELLVGVYRAIYQEGHPYRESIRGSVATVSAITRDQACKFADAYYAPGNAALVISGNVPADRVEAALGKFLARIPKRLGAAANHVAAARKQPAREVTALIDDAALVLTWPVPTEPYAQLTMKLIAAVTMGVIDSRIKGTIAFLPLGDVRAPVVGYYIVPADGEKMDTVLKVVENTLDDLPEQLESRGSGRMFDKLRQYAIYGQYATLEDGSGRDEAFAEHVLAGRNPAEALAEQFRALRNLGRDDTANVARRYLAFQAANVVKLKPNTDKKKRGRAITMRAATHDMGQRRTMPDIARAREPDASVAVPTIGTVTRVLPNGLKIVMLPLSSVPTVDVRLVFGAGTADDPPAKRGSALVAAKALTWDLRYINDLLSFSSSGGSMDVDVARDHTSFAVKGVDMHLDYLLAGLRRWAIDGRYSDDSDSMLETFQSERKLIEPDEDDALNDAWYTALYGANHPYARAGVLRYTSSGLTIEDAERFRNSYFTPDNATLVLAGHIDVAIANQWIDYLFTDWRGRVQPRRTAARTLAAASIAKVEDLTQMLIMLALPAPSGSRAQHLVAAAMLDDIARDVRHQLGAAYVFGARLAEHRQATNIFVEGWIDPSRANEVLELIRKRVQTLRSDADAAARAFVIARGRVITALASLTGSASLLAARAEFDIGLGRAPLADLQTAKEVQVLTIDHMKPILTELDLATAAVAMRGPADAVKSAFQLLGREPTIVRVDQAVVDAADDPTAQPTRRRGSRDEDIYFSDLEEALTDQGFAAKSRLEITAAVGLSSATMGGDVYPPGETVAIESGASGLAVSAEIGIRLTKRFSAGLHLGLGQLGGDYDKQLLGQVVDQVPFTLTPLEAGVFAHSRILERLWGGLVLGAQRVTFEYQDQASTSMGYSFGVELGYDIVNFGAHSLAGFVRATASYGSEVGLGVVTAAVAYRH